MRPMHVLFCKDILQELPQVITQDERVTSGRFNLGGSILQIRSFFRECLEARNMRLFYQEVYFQGEQYLSQDDALSDFKNMVLHAIVDVLHESQIEK